MIISGLVLQCDPALTEGVVAMVLAESGISDLTVTEQEGRLVCVLEAPSPEASASAVDRLVQIAGVIAVMPTYIHELEEEERWIAVHS